MKKMFLLAAALCATSAVMAMNSEAVNAVTPAKARQVVADLQVNGVKPEDVDALKALSTGALEQARPYVTLRKAKRDSLVLEGKDVVIPEDPQRASARAALIGFTLGAAQIVANTTLTPEQQDEALDAEYVQAVRQQDAVASNPASRAALDVLMDGSILKNK